MSLREIIQDKKKLDQLCRLAFEVVDTDKSGFLDRNELEAVMYSVGSELGIQDKNSQDVESIMKELDKLEQGKVAQQEFRALVEKILTELVQEEAPGGKE